MKIFENIANLIRRLFSKPKMLNSGEKKEETIEKKENLFTTSLQIDNKDYKNKKNIIDEINKKPELIDTLPYSRLVQLNKIYEERIKEIKMKIKKIDKKIDTHT